MAALDLLLHICCAPCATFTVQHLVDRDIHVTGYWFNPNIQPYGEHQKRRENLAQYASQIRLPVIWEQKYWLVDFVRAIAGHERFRERCRLCYRLRLGQTVAVAASRGFEAVSTTLLISPYQDQEAIREIGTELATRQGLLFYTTNLRQGYGTSRTMAREAGLYMQRYCGCILSEWEAQDHEASTLSRESIHEKR
jgi:predicted adenine nucleotide alpha hydrolase (AANH) superfamily ATPase